MHHLAIRVAGSAAILLPTLIGVAQAQQTLTLPRSELSVPGAAMKPSSVRAPDIDISAYSDVRGAEAMAMKFSDEIPHTRGVQDISLFRADAPSVVLILTKDALGSGSLLQDNLILTNFHVVDRNREVTVVFKPANANGRPSQDEVVRADVVKIDVQRDLALIRPRSLPNRSVLPLQIASKEIEVGSDVAAIGHPIGQDWTFTKGIVSAIRSDYEWSGDGGLMHRATVIQTQTPINPGNSGGPLLSDDGKIVGVNSFAAKNTQGLNFAVAAKEIVYFLQNRANGLEAQRSCNEARTIFEGRNQKNTALLRQISLQCDDTADVTFVVPDDRRQPFIALVDLKRRGKPEGIVFDLRRSGTRWDTSVWDSQLDDTFALRGVHPDGKLMPTSFVSRCVTGKPLPDLKCG